MNYFKKFPTVPYDINRTGSTQQVVDIYRQVRPLNDRLDQQYSYTQYRVQDGERPDIVSQRLYGTPIYYWTFFVVNNFLHDGYKVWPMSTRMLESYIEKEFEGWAISSNPTPDPDSDGITNTHINSIAGKFQLGETITGGTSNATGTLIKKDIDKNQLIVKNVTGSFIGTGTVTELVVGSTSQDSVSTFKAWKYADAPHRYYKNVADANGNITEREFSNIVFTESPDAVNTGNINNVINNNYEPSYATEEGLLDEIGIPQRSQLAEADATGASENGLQYESNRAHIIRLNDERSNLRVIRPDSIAQFAKDYMDLLNE
jgi:hypothetical protein